jgi:hypothetical protein
LFTKNSFGPFALWKSLLVPAFLLVSVAPIGITQPASNPSLAATPPLGWNSWDSFGSTVREDEVKANADYMAAHMAAFGWQYIVVDIAWYRTHGHNVRTYDPESYALDSYGRFVPRLNRFPSAANGNGFKPLADYVPRKGRKLGIHIMRGIPRKAVADNLPIYGSSSRAPDVADKNNVCKWLADTYGIDMSKPGAQEYYDSIAALYASWGVDYVKADDMSSPYQAAEIQALSTALRKTGRPIVLSLSPGPAPVAMVEDLRKWAQLWRISNDFWDNWKALKPQFEVTKVWAPFIRAGAWPDADMLPLGHFTSQVEVGKERNTNFTKDEQYTLMTLDAIFRSPLMMGGDLPANDAFTLSLLTNREVLRVNQHSTGNRPVLVDAQKALWVAETEAKGGYYVAVFNLGESPETYKYPWKDLGFGAPAYRVRDLWSHRNLGRMAMLTVTLPPHGAALYQAVP